MTRKEFMSELAARLHRLPRKDLQAVLQYYEEYFDEAGREHEQEVIRQLGSPAHVASNILADYAVKKAKTAHSSTKSGWHALWFAILAICAAPVAVPLIIAAVAVVVALGVSGFALIFALLVAAGAIFIKGVSCLFFGSTSSLLLFGSAFVLIGCALLVFHGIGALIACVVNHVKKKSGGSHEKETLSK